jgi:uncharacterized membrane-anchored protein
MYRYSTLSLLAFALAAIGTVAYATMGETGGDAVTMSMNLGYLERAARKAH